MVNISELESNTGNGKPALRLVSRFRFSVSELSDLSLGFAESNVEWDIRIYNRLRPPKLADKLVLYAYFIDSKTKIESKILYS